MVPVTYVDNIVSMLFELLWSATRLKLTIRMPFKGENRKGEQNYYRHQGQVINLNHQSTNKLFSQLAAILR